MRRIELALGSYRAAKNAIQNELPAKVRARLRALLRSVERARTHANRLPQTVIPLFLRYPPRHPSTTLREVYRDVEDALNQAAAWKNARVPDYAKRRMLVELGAALDEICRVKLTARRDGIYHHCAELLLRAVRGIKSDFPDLTRSLRAAIHELSR